MLVKNEICAICKVYIHLCWKGIFSQDNFE